MLLYLLILYPKHPSPFYKASIQPRLEYVIQAPSSNPTHDAGVIENVQELAVMFVKGLRHVPHKLALQRLCPFPLTHLQACGDHISLFKITQGLLETPTEPALTNPARPGLRCHAASAEVLFPPQQGLE